MCSNWDDMNINTPKQSIQCIGINKLMQSATHIFGNLVTLVVYGTTTQRRLVFKPMNQQTHTHTPKHVHLQIASQ